jgi:hypothetical protein
VPCRPRQAILRIAVALRPGAQSTPDEFVQFQVRPRLSSHIGQLQT